MERILVPVNAGEKDIRVTIHGLQLASRISGVMYILEIDQADSNTAGEAIVSPKPLPQLDSLFAAQTFEEEVRCEYFRVRGDYCTEVIRFCLQKQITTLVLEIGTASRKVSPSSLLQMISALQAKKVCRVELIGKK